MATVKYLEQSEADARVEKIFEEIKATLGTPFVPNLFKAMAHHPDYLESSWKRVKIIMAPGKLDAKTKEMIAVAVSATNGCNYCVHAHTSSLRAMGTSDGELVELMAVVDLFSGFNKMIEGLQVDIDLDASR